MLLCRDRSPLRAYDIRMKKRDKTFAARAERWLKQNGSRTSAEEDQPVRCALTSILAVLKGTATTLHDDALLTEPPDEAPIVADDWSGLAETLAHEAAALDLPDPDRAAHLVDLAQALLAACEVASAAARAADALAARRLALVEQIEALGDDAVTVKLRTAAEQASAEALDRIDEVVRALPDLLDARDIGEAEVAQRQREFDDARATDDEVRSDEAYEAEKKAKRDRDAARHALAAALASVEIAAYAPETVEDVCPTADMPEAADPGPADLPQLSPEPARVPEPDCEPVTYDTADGLVEEAASMSADFCTQVVTSPELPAAAPIVPSEWPVEPCDVAMPSGVPALIEAGLAVRDMALETDRPPEDVVAEYLERGETALAGRLAELAARRGVGTGAPGAILQALALAPAIRHSDDLAPEQVQTALATAMSELDAWEQEGDPVRAERARRLAFAALLRPAMFDLSLTYRPQIAAVAARIQLHGASQLGSVLGALGYDVSISADEIAEIAGREAPPKRLPAAVQQLQRWLEDAQGKRTAHTPTTQIFRRAALPGGRLGRVLSKACSDDAAGDAEARELLNRLLDNRQEQERFVEECERETGRPAKNPIGNTALNWFCIQIQDGCVLLHDVLDARVGDAARVDDYRRAALIATIGQLRKLLDGIESDDRQEDTPLDRAIRGALDRSIADLKKILDGSAVAGGRVRARMLLDTPLLRLVGTPAPSTLPPGGPTGAEAEQRLYRALMQPERLCPSVREAIPARLAESAHLAVRDLLELLRRGDGDGEVEAFKRLKQEISENETAARQKARERVDRLRSELSTFLNLELFEADELRDRLVRLSVIGEALLKTERDAEGIAIPAFNGVGDPSIPPDFPELEGLLDKIAAFRDERERGIQKQQRQRLEDLARNTATRQSAETLLDLFDKLDPVTRDNMIGQIQAGLPVLGADLDRQDAFRDFFPRFVEQMAAPSAPKRAEVTSAVKQGSAVGPFDFRDLDLGRAEAVQELIKAWQACDTTFGTQSPKLLDHLRSLFGLLGFTGASVSNNRVLADGLSLFSLTADVPEQRPSWFLPPAYGSAAQGRYPVLIARSNIGDDRISAALGKEGRDKPWFVLLFGRLDVRRREAMALVLRDERHSALFIDETLLLFLAQPTTERMGALFTCAAPFGWLQSYTTNPRVIPPEMFFGRRDEIDRIVARQSTGCLVYGGRQLGKSALLNYIATTRDRPGAKERAIDLDIKPVGGQDAPTSEIWKRLAQRLHEAGVLSIARPTKDTVRDAIRGWISADPERRLLVMLDEADRFLAAEARADYSNLLEFKRLMEDSNWRFKVVFAGLHNVRRMTRAPNTPLAHLGEPVCVGPLDTSTENLSEARRLATEPMLAAGYCYETPDIAADILARVNHYPSLVQVFCKSVVENVSRQRSRSRGPRWVLAREQLFEGKTAEDIAGEIRARFQLTLDLDPRFDLIAKRLALYRLDHADGTAAVLREGLPAERIKELAEEYWPERLERMAPSMFAAFLEEMMELGVLGRLGPGRYGLRNAQVALMLGQRSDIEDALLGISEREADVDYDDGTFYRRAPGADADHRAPLPDRELHRMFSETTGVSVVVCAKALFGAEVPKYLRDFAESWDSPTPVLRALVVDPDNRSIRQVVERSVEGRLALIVRWGWEESIVDWLSNSPRVKSGKVTVTLLAEPGWLVRQVVAGGHGGGASVFVAAPWGEAMLRYWMDDHGVRAFDDRATRDALLDASGGAPVRLARLREVLQRSSGNSVSTRIANIESWKGRTSLRAAEVLDGDALKYFLAFADAAYTGTVTDEDIQTGLPDVPIAAMGAFETLGFVRCRTPGAWELAPLGKLLGR